MLKLLETEYIINWMFLIYRNLIITIRMKILKVRIIILENKLLMFGT
nr:MAG TPA: hypothetical protein [Bacteriophage sp.]